MAPHAKFSFPQFPAEFHEDLAKVAGCKSFRGSWTIPYNAVEPMKELLAKHNVSPTAGRWVQPPPTETTWAEVETRLRAGGEVKDFVFDFLLPYQKDAIAYGWPRSGLHFWIPTGCLSGETELTVNKAGKSFKITLARLKARFHDEIKTRGRKWDATMPTKTQSAIGGVIRLNEIVDVFYTGRKTTYIVTTDEGKRIRATLDHKFMRPDGSFSPLAELKAGDIVLVAGEQSSPAKPKKVKEAKLASIELYGEEDTYDMTMKNPHPHYVAGGFAVHNSGKTVIGIVTALAAPGPIIVVTRASAKPQYAREIERFLNVRTHILRPKSAPKRKKSQTLEQYLREAKAEGYRPFLVVGWENLPDRLEELTALLPGSVVFDETHHGAKNSKRWEVIPLPDLPQAPPPEADQKTMMDWRARFESQTQKENLEAKEKKGFIKDTDDGRKMFVPVLNISSAGAKLARSVLKRIGTSATPIKNRTKDLWSQLDLVEPNAWGNATTWQNQYAARRPGTYGGFDSSGSSNLDELKTRLKSLAFILPYAETHRQLPAKRRQAIYVAPEEQCRESAGFSKELKEATSRGPSATAEVKLAQAASKKRKAVLGMLEEAIGSGHKVVVFTGRKRDCDILGAEVQKLMSRFGLSNRVWTGHGDHSTDARQKMVDAYMESEGPAVLVGTGHSFGESLNLQDSDALFLVMLPLTPGQLRQWEGRVARLGQKRPVTIYYVIAEGTIDEHYASILIGKLPAVEKVVEDVELAAAGPILAGFDENQTAEEFASSVLATLDIEEEDDENG
jgi:hypothetical protein